MTKLPAAPFLDLIGISPPHIEDGKAVTDVELAPHHMNRLQSAHGGVIATLLDTAMVGAARAAATPDSRLATLEMKTSFMRPGKGKLRCEAGCVHASGTLAFCEADIRDVAGKLIATGSGTYRYVVGSASPRSAAAGTP
jgi:uncharacterized protein (TIGR00369 family)